MEEIIKIEKTQLSPKVVLDKEKGIFLITGKSGVENAEAFYSPILKWFIEYFKNPDEITKINLYLDYLNSASSVQIGKLLSVIDENLKKTKLVINWIYDEDDELMKETGKEFQFLYNIKFNFIEKDENKDLQDYL